MAMKGTLAEGVLPGLLRSLYVGRKSGRLHFIGADARRVVRIQRGQMIAAESNAADERLGETLVRLGQLSQADLDRATEIVIREKKRLGVALAELKLFDEDRLQDALSLQVHEILKRVFSMTSGEFEFEELPDAVVDEDMTLKVSTGELILEAVDRVRDPEVVRRSLGDLERFQKVTLTPTDGFILSRVDGMTTGREIITMLPMPEDEVCRSLLGLLSTGLVEFAAPVPKKAPVPRPAPAPAPPPSAPPPAPEPPRAAPAAPPAAPAPPAAAAKPAAAPAAPPAPKVETVEDRRREILEAWNGLKTRNNHEILGVASDATAPQVKDAYFRLARRFHPDVHTDPALADMRDKLEAVFIRLGRAYEALKDRAPAAPPHPPAAAAPPPAPAPAAPAPPVSPAPSGPTTDPRVVMEALKRGHVHFLAEKYWDAIQALEGVVHQAEGKMQGKVRLLLAQCYMKNPNWVRRAEEQLQLIVAKEPSNAEAHYILASIYKAGGLKNRALTFLRKVVELKPEHEQAQADLAELTMPTEPETPQNEGLLKKLFGKS
jgi:tetratricopeptide (TPR) repeat protein